VARLADEFGRRAVQVDLRGGQLARAELILEAVEFDVAPAAVGLARFQVEQCEVFRALRGILRPRQRERGLRIDRRREPFAPVQAPASVFLARDGFARRYVGPACGLGHPLSADPLLGRVAAEEMRQRAFDQACIPRRLQRDRGAVGHRQRAGVELAGTMEQVHHCKLVHARGVRVQRFVAGRDQAIARRDRLCCFPRRSQLDAIDALAPGRPMRQSRLGGRPSACQRPGSGSEFAQVGQVAFDRGMRRGRQDPAQVRAQYAIVDVLVAQYRRGLGETHGTFPQCAAKL
jgi:hypothetical protein